MPKVHAAVRHRREVKGLVRELSAFRHRREVKAPLRECV